MSRTRAQRGSKKPAKGKRAARKAEPAGTDPTAGPAAEPAVEATVGATVAAPAPQRGPAGSGQRLYDMPYGSPAPPLVNRELGLDTLVARRGHNAGYDIDLTLLDAPDHRMIRSGVLLAHRVLDGRGEWYLGAPDWVPLLPKELLESMSQADLSENLSDLIRPFRRRSPLTPVAALHCERREFALRSGGSTIALLRDDKVTVRRGGLTIARYREVMMTPVGSGLDQAQADWLDRCLTEAGATVLSRFPRLVRRLGAPATGPTDFPEPAPFAADAPFSAFVCSLVALRLRELLAADLGLRGGSTDAGVELVKAAHTLSRELDGLRRVLDEAWVADLIDELDWLAAVPVEADLVIRLRGERYLSLLDRLVVAARGTRLGEVAAEPAGAVLDRLAAEQLAVLVRACSRVAVDGASRVWDEAGRALERMDVVDAVVARLRPDEVAERHRRLSRVRPLLAQVHRLDAAAADLMARVDGASPADAFALGREYERNREAVQTARSAFAVGWAKARRKLVGNR